MSRALPGLTATAIILSGLAQPLGAQTRPSLTIDPSAPATVAVSGGATVHPVGPPQVEDARYSMAWGRESWLKPPSAKRHHGMAGAVIGALIGGTAGGLLTFKSTESVEHNLTYVPLAVLGGGVAGGLIGYAIGRSAGSESPTPATTAGMRVTLSPRAIGVGVTF